MKKPNEKKFVIPWLRISGAFAAGCGLFIADQIRRVYCRINNSVVIDVLKHDRYQPTYIYIEDPFFQEQIQEGDLLRRERLKLTRLHKWLYDKIEESFIFRNWWKFRTNLAWRFLTVAKGDSLANRLRAVRSLASLRNLSDSDYQQLAQACDLQTAVGLARSTDNLKFLLDPPYFKLKPSRQAILRHLHDFLLALDSEAKHPCLQYFISKVFGDITETDNKTFDDDLGVKVSHSEQIPMCIEALLHHSWIGANAKYIVSLGGLPLLTEIYKYLAQEDPNNIDSLIMLSRLMSNITIFDECKDAFFRSGWIKLLAVLSQHKDIRVSAPAQRALLNFDEDDISAGEKLKFYRKIYQLYPKQRMKGVPKIDVVFLHGLLGGVFITWRQRDTGNCGHKSPLELLGIVSSDEDKVFAYQTNKPNELDSDFIVDISDLTDWEHLEKGYELVLSDIPVDANWKASGPFYTSDISHSCEYTKPTKCWPSEWLPSDCPEARIIGVNYETNISMWAPMCPIVTDRRNLTDRSSYLSQVLAKAGVGNRPIVWVAHSMGGLLVKDMLVQSMSSSDPGKRSLFDQTKAIVFYSTPHKGSRLAALNATSQMIIWPSVEVQELRENSPALLELHEKFLESLNDHPMKIVSFAERESTYITSLKFEIRFVDNVSADPDVGELYGIPLDHLCICKPACKQSFLYQKVLEVIKGVVNDTSKK